MPLQAKLDAFKVDFEAGKPPYNVPRSVIETMDRATAELIASDAARRARKAGDVAPSFALKDPEGNIVRSRRIGKAIARIPEFMMPRQGFYPRGGGPRWRADRPYHVALEDQYIREHWDEIYAICRLNSLPFNATGEVIQSDGVWRVYEFAWQMDAILFWDRFQGRWLRGTEFHYL
jgi:hypothetical protein